MSDELHFTQEEIGRRATKPAMHAVDGHIFRPPWHSNPYMKSESYLSVLKLYCTSPHILLFHCTIFITSCHTIDDLYRRQMLNLQFITHSFQVSVINSDEN